MDYSHLLDKDGNQDKYYVSFNQHKRILQQPIKLNPTPTPEYLKKDGYVECDEITCIQDLISLANKYPICDDIVYKNVNMEALHRIVPYLKKLDEMIGLKSLKQSLSDQIVYYLQPIEKINDYKHTVLYGPPGTGKTEVAELIGHIFANIGIFGENPGKFRKVSRSDLVAGYLGQTATKTNDVIKSCFNGVLFIDEAYSLGNVDKKDTYSKECIDTLCEALSAHKDKLMVIIAGYESELNDCFFGYNPGLKSRFAWKFTIDGYSAEDLYHIFMLKWNSCQIPFVHSPNVMIQWFSKRSKHFESFGRDIDTFVSKIKIAYSRRTFCKKGEGITMADIEKGYEAMVPLPNNKNSKPKCEYNMYS
jgi:SpoVK/Ycf46/Vps4 family AAA+-type ATPase